MPLLGEITVTRRRRDGGAWTAGRWVRGAAVDTSFSASVQRREGINRQALSEGDRQSVGRHLLTQQLGFLRTEDQANTLEADEVIIAGQPHTVTHVDDDHPLIAYERVFVTQVQEVSAAVPNATLQQVENGVRNWFIAMGVSDGIPNPDRAVIFANENGPRPPLPYVVINVESYDERVGYDEEQVGATGLRAPRGQRSGIVSLTGYGAESEDWMERAIFLINTPETTAASPDVTVEPIGGSFNQTALLDQDQQQVYRRELAVTYVRIPDTDDRVQGTELDTVVHTDDLGGRVVTNTVTLP